ncbi:hypothetical protein Y032_0362g3509 [Ancylostoma ceylanicum]|uniref:Uncharacterized protein n=1 Tax=Ancylostoma ceylanicum TaxID=53326 RepID=A0A016RW30_9BILA|nr:hypothetical protein Y032_0362g3509 [Ancylostoma ceylanicum]
MSDNFPFKEPGDFRLLKVRYESQRKSRAGALLGCIIAITQGIYPSDTAYVYSLDLNHLLRCGFTFFNEIKHGKVHRASAELYNIDTMTIKMPLTEK